LSITEIRLLEGWRPKKADWNEREKDKNNPPLRGLGGGSVSVLYSKLFMACTKFGTFFLTVSRKSSIFAEKERLWQY